MTGSEGRRGGCRRKKTEFKVTCCEREGGTGRGVGGGGGVEGTEGVKKV